MSGHVPGSLCHRLGMAVPVVQAPIGSATTPELVAAVGNAGGLGTLAASWLPLDTLVARLARIRRLTDRAFGVNLVLEWPQDGRMDLCLRSDVPLVSTAWGDPRPYVDRIHAAGALHLHTVGSVDEASRAADAGVDGVIAQGWEAGGHVRGETTTMALIPAVVDAVWPVPVLAAGGIADGRGVAAALALGAEAACVGTRFLLADEADVHQEYRDRVVAARSTDTVYGTIFTEGWPNAPHRCLRNSTTARWEAARRPAHAECPGEADIVAHYGDGRPIRRCSDTIPTAGITGQVEALAHYAGQAVGLVSGAAPAGDIVAELSAGLSTAAQDALALWVGPHRA